MSLTRVLRAAPGLTLFVMLAPIAAGLAGTIIPAFGPGGWSGLFAWPGLRQAAILSLTSGLFSTLIALALALALVAALQGGRTFNAITRMISPLLGLPHAAAALGLAFMVSPSGWIARALSPWATGWTEPPDILVLNDPWGIALTLGLVVKELPFLLLMLLAALPQADAPRRLRLAASLGYDRVTGWFLAVLPAVWPQMRMPTLAVLAYGMTTVDMAVILGPSLPPTLSVRIASWMMHADFALHATAAAGALLQLLLVGTAILALLCVERCLAMLGRWRTTTGRRGRFFDAAIGPLAACSGVLVVALASLGMVSMALWSVAGPWSFPDALPESLTLQTWQRAAPGLVGNATVTVIVGMVATGTALILVAGCLEAEVRFGLTPGRRSQWLLYLPLIVPQIAFLPGLQLFVLLTGAEGSLLAVAAAHLVFVLPYVFLSLGPNWRAWDRRIGLAGSALGASPDRVLFRLRLPMLLGAILTAAAVGFAVSVGQYLPTLLIGGGRVTTLTTEAVALSSGGNRRIAGAFAMSQVILPAAGFALAILLPAQIFRHRIGMSAAR